MSIDRPRVRFAPSPTGSLHLGNARTALYNWLVARQRRGALVLRIEDTDIDRQREGAEAAILEDLRWLGLDWDEGPDIGGAHGPYRQSARSDRYREAATRLFESGRAYRCFCSEEQLRSDRAAARSSGAPLHYRGRCRELDPAESETRASRGEPFAVRFRIGGDDGAPVVRFADLLRGVVTVDIAELGDPVILRRDGRPTYNFAAAVDDAEMEIDLVLRGDDHLSNTPRQVLMFRALGHDLPQFAHLPMVRGADGARLSKRHGAESLSEYRRRGYPPQALLNALALLGWGPRDDRVVLDREELLAGFELERIGRSPAAFDPDKLDWLSGQHLKRRDPAELAPEVGRWLVQANRLPAEALERARGWLERVAELVGSSITRLEQVPERCAPLFAPGGEPVDEDGRLALREPGAVAVVGALAALLEERPPVGREEWLAIKREVARRSGLKGRALFRPIRVALTGSASGPELDLLVPLIAEGQRLLPGQVPALAERAERTLEWLQ